MLFKIIAVIVATVLIYGYEPLHAFWIPFAIIALAVVFVIEGVRVVPQQSAWVVERLGKFHETLQPGLNIIIPFFDRVAYRHSLKEVPARRPRAGLHHQGQHPARGGRPHLLPGHRSRASPPTAPPTTSPRSCSSRRRRCAREVGKMELDQSLQSRDVINRQIVNVLDEAGRSWGVKVLRYEVKNLTPPETDPARDAGADHRRARKARADRQVRGREAAGDQPRRGREAGGDPHLRGTEAVGDQQGAGRGDRAARGGGRDRGGGERRRRRDRQGRRAAGARTSRWPSSTSARSATSPRPTTP